MRMLQPHRPLLAMSLICLFGCTTTNHDFKHDLLLTNSKLLMSPEDAMAVGYRIGWATDLSLSSNEQISSLAVLDDLILVVEAPSNRISAVSLRDGTRRWTIVLGDATTQLFQPMHRDDRIYVASPARLYTLAARNGELLHVDNFDTPLSSDPILVRNFAICGGFSGRLFAHDLTSGYGKWQYDLTTRIEAKPVLAGFDIFSADTSGVYAMLSSIDGALRWRGRTFGAVTAPPAIDQMAVYLPSKDQTLYALDRATGNEKWKLPLEIPLTYSPVSIGLNLYLPLNGHGTVAIDAIAGQVRWRIPEVAQALQGDEQRILMATDSSLQLLDSANGSTLARGATGLLQSVLLGPDDSIVLVSPLGRMLRLNPLK